MSRPLLPRKYMQYLGLGAEIAASLVIPILVGYYIDVYFDISPLGILSGVGLGFLLFILMILRLAKSQNSD